VGESFQRRWPENLQQALWFAWLACRKTTGPTAFRPLFRNLKPRSARGHTKRYELRRPLRHWTPAEHRGEAQRTGRWKTQNRHLRKPFDQALDSCAAKRDFATLKITGTSYDTWLPRRNKRGFAAVQAETAHLTPLPQRGARPIHRDRGRQSRGRAVP